jgi:Transport protein Avl9
LTAADRRWIDFLTQTINETWDPSHPEQPKTHGYVGSEEFIRLQFEDYLLALLSCTNHRQHIQPSSPIRTSEPKNKGQAADLEGDPTVEFNQDFVAHWQTTRNYDLFNRLTSDAMLFSVVEPRHPCAGGLTIDDIQRRLAQQVSELHLDERVREGREALNKTLSTGQKKVSSALNSFWADIESLREAQRKRNEERAMERASSDEKSLSGEALQAIRNNTTSVSTTTTSGSGSGSDSAETSSFSWFGNSRRSPSVDVSQGQAPVNTAGQRAGAYISSWGTWASERRKEWQDRRTSAALNSTPAATTTTTTTSSSTTTSTSSEAALPSVMEKELDDSNNNNNTTNYNTTRDDPSSSSSRRGSEESSTTTTTNLGRSISRRTKRWSSVLLKKEYRNSNIHNNNSNDSDYESSSSRKGSLDITVPSSLSIADAPKSPLGQVQHQQEQSVEEDDKDEPSVEGGATTTNILPPKAEEEVGTVTKSGDDGNDDGTTSK